MKRLVLLACLSFMACGSMASASDTVVRVEGDQLLVVLPDGNKLLCHELALSPGGKTTATLTVVNGSVQLKSGDTIVRATELRFPAPAAKPAAK